MKSVTGAVWQKKPVVDAVADGLVEKTGMPLALAMVLAGRGLTKEGADSWLEPKLRDLMPDPMVLKDMDKMVSRLAQAVEGGETIGIFGDYDVDGACSAAVLHDVLTPLGCSVSVHIPDRFAEGYGPNLPALMKLKEGGCSLIITVDCGITAHRPIEEARKAGADVLIIDHHLAGSELPKAEAVVNPNRLDDDAGLGYLAAAGVCFLVAAGLLRRLRQGGHFDSKPEPELMMSLDLVALATICDVVPIQGLNRAYVRTGLEVMARRQRLGLASLADQLKLTHAPDVYALGFRMGPCINAGGRLGASPLGVDLLTTRDAGEAKRLAEQLVQMNEDRKAIEQDITKAAIAQLEGQIENLDSAPLVIMAADENWHEGVIGISASRLKEHFGRIAAVISVKTGEDGQRIGKGSARSIPPFRLGSAVISAQQSGILIGGGGHDTAAGFTLDMENFNAFKEFMNSRAKADFQKASQDNLAKEHQIDATLGAGAANLNLLNWMERAGPFGSGFPEPQFVLHHVRVKSFRQMGKDKVHLAITLEDSSGKVESVLFNAGNTNLGKALMLALDGQPISVLGRLQRNRYQGREKPQFIIKDMSLSP